MRSWETCPHAKLTRNEALARHRSFWLGALATLIACLTTTAFPASSPRRVEVESSRSSWTLAESL